GALPRLPAGPGPSAAVGRVGRAAAEFRARDLRARRCRRSNTRPGARQGRRSPRRASPGCASSSRASLPPSRPSTIPGHAIRAAPDFVSTAAREALPAAHGSQPQSRHVLAEVGFADRLPDLVEVRLFAPKVELVAHAQQHRLLLYAGRAALAGRQQHARGGIQFQQGGGADQLQLQVAVHTLDAGQGIDLITHTLPFRLREQPQAAVFERVVGDYQTVIAGARDRFAVGGGNRQPTLVIHSYCGFALKHRWNRPTFSHKITPNSTLVAGHETVKKILLADQG